MTNVINSRYLLLLVLLLTYSALNAQDATVKEKKVLKNTISYNLTNTIIFGGKSYVIGYERIIKPNQSIAIEVGKLSLPGISVLPSSVKANSATSEKGFKFTLEYRFYLSKFNKYNAPRGVYVAPYYAYNSFNRKKSFDIDTSSTGVPVEVGVNTNFNLEIHTLGAELGYQFVFWRRVALDLVLIGPGISKYSVKMKLDTTLDPDDESTLFKAINDALDAKVPGYGVAIKPGEFNKTGTTNTTSIGFRYLIHLGLRF